MYRALACHFSVCVIDSSRESLKGIGSICLDKHSHYTGFRVETDPDFKVGLLAGVSHSPHPWLWLPVWKLCACACACVYVGGVVSGPPQGVSSWESTPKGEIQKPRTPWLSSRECIFSFFSTFAPLPLLLALSFLPPSRLWVFCLPWCEWCLNWFKNTKLRIHSKIHSPWSLGNLVQHRCDCSRIIQHLCNTGVIVVGLFSSSGRMKGVQILRFYFFY